MDQDDKYIRLIKGFDVWWEFKSEKQKEKNSIFCQDIQGKLKQIGERYIEATEEKNKMEIRRSPSSPLITEIPKQQCWACSQLQKPTSLKKTCLIPLEMTGDDSEDNIFEWVTR